MEALIFTAKTKKLELVKTDIPKLKNDKQLLIKVAYSGICGTDLHILQGQFPCNQNVPFSLGHEFSGVVVDAGQSVCHIKKGDRVSIDPNHGCNLCQFCHSGNPHFCQDGGINNTIGIYRDGGWSEYVLVPEEQVHKLPENITLEQAALCEPLSCLAHGWDIISPVTVGQKILITGAGIIGNLWVVSLHLQGHRRVTVSEPNLARLTALEKLNTGYDLVTPDILNERSKKDPQYVFDLIIDCSGFAPAVEKAFDLLGHGGKLCLFGVAPPSAKISLSPFQIYMKELKIFGVNINPFTFPKAIGLAEALGSRYLNYENLGAKTFELRDYKAALECLKQGTIAKAVFKF